ncbi:MAG: trypsin-like peptidase domain-containing protein [Patescibacteria group bacterium]|nr:trypsin-like peptidase domain-containing protein [Patescibacteria group bacterium]
MTISEKRTVQIIKKVLPAVVSISVFKNQDKRQDSKISFSQKPKNSLQEGGSGFFVDNKGTIVTTLHVISSNPETEYQITTFNNKVYKAKKIGVSFVNDVAFLKIEPNVKTPFIPLGDSSNLQLGQEVFAIGNVLGIFQNTVSKGIISGLSRSIVAKNQEMEEDLHGLIQTDAAINPGNSGGPLIDSQGKVIGINSASVAYAENIGFAIPINSIKKELEKIRRFGSLKIPFLGVRYILINKKVQEIFKVPVNQGALVASPNPKIKPAVIPRSPAEKGGIKEGDIILEINNLAITPQNKIEEILEKTSQKEILKIKLLRKGKIKILQIKLD